MRKLLWIMFGMVIASSCEMSKDGDADFVTDVVGTGGSTARFAIYGDFLYVVDNTSINVFDISDVEDPFYQTSVDVGWGIETIYGYKDNLFIGSQTGMFIYSIQNNGAPVYLSDYIHQTSCDPVIANDEYAYVTTRSGENCGTRLFEANQLITLDVTDLTNPFATSEQQMINPRGLCFFRGDLFVAEGNNGLKQFSLEDPSNPTLIQFFEDIAANDMIALDNTMIITRDEGIYQFGFENSELHLLSPIE